MWTTIITKIKAALTGNSLLHGAYIAALAAIAQYILPILSAWNSGTTAPVFNFTNFWHIVVGAFGLYIIKNMVFGGSSVPSASNTTASK